MIFQPQFSDSGVPLSEYPRPQMKRESYFSLNGKWEYAIRKVENIQGYDGEIIVPYSPESLLSGVDKQVKKDDFLFYKRQFRLPDRFQKDKVFLNVGACDQVCKVYLNGVLVGEHEGGYLPFSLEITQALKEENELVFVVQDNADSDVYGRGKQKYKRGGIWYTATSGIWQSVWLESVPALYIEKFKLLPDYDEKQLKICFEKSGKGTVSVCIKEGEEILSTGETDGDTLTLDVSMCKEWTTDAPELYEVEIRFGEDFIQSYFGLRKFSVVQRGEYKFFALNDKPIFHNGLLDQGYWQQGMYTPPTNRAMYEEVKSVKELGFNMLRKHIKVEPMLWYYYCDILGVLVWQDMINGGKKYNPLRIALCPFLNLHLNDTDYKAMGRSEASREWYYQEAYGLIDALYNCVSLCLWTPFNEAWGQFDAYKVWEDLKQKDGSRLYDHASGWQDMGGGDVCSKHIYFRKARMQNDRKRVLALTEFGGYSYGMEGHVFSSKRFGYKKFSTQNGLMNAIEKLYYEEIAPLIETEGLGATVYTELTDVEDEINGLYTYDRVLKVDAERIRDINAAVYDSFRWLIKKLEQ